MTPDVALSLLYVLRVQLDAVTMAVEQAFGMSQEPSQVEAGSCPACKAAPDTIEDLSTLDGTKRFRCPSCGNVWEPVI